MNEKYYTPSTDEFHEGFLYEWNYNNEGWKVDEFDISTGDTDCMAGDFYEFYPACPKTKCRVKYLDKEDVESLGWIYTDNYLYEGKSFYLNGFRMDYDFLKKSAYIIFPQTEMIIYLGPIKNKSELIRLMKQLDLDIK